MKQEDKLKEVAGKGSPFSIPENYFETFRSNLMSNLPDYPEKPAEQKVSVWHRIRPYVYLAAMFAGIWCMMKIFYHTGGMNTTGGSTTSIENAIADYEPDSYDLFVSTSEGDDIEIQDEVIELYSSMDEFKRDFYAAAIN